MDRRFFWVCLAWMLTVSLSGCGSKETSTVSEAVGIQEPTQAIVGETVPTGQISFYVRYMHPSGKLAGHAAFLGGRFLEAGSDVFVYDAEKGRILWKRWGCFGLIWFDMENRET